MCKTRLLAGAVLALTAPMPVFAQDNADYRHLMFRESPYAPYRGIHPIDPDQAETVAHYDFSYDAQGRVTRIAYQIGDTPIGDNGVFDTFIWFAPEVRIAYEDGREVHTYYGRGGEQISAHGDVYRAVYTLDGDGTRTALEFFDESGAPSQNAWGVHRYSWRPSDDGHIFETRYDLAGEMVAMRPELEFYEIKLEYDRDGRLAFMRNYGRNGEPTNNPTGAGIDRITYDLAGNFIRWQVYDHAGNAVEGNTPGVHLGEHLYDANGNKIGMRGFDRHGNVQTFSWGTVLNRVRYDERGNRAEIRNYGPDWNEVIRLQWTWSEDGTRVTAIRSLTPEGELVAHPAMGGAALLRFERDEAGGVSRLAFNADMTPFTPAEPG